MISRIYYILKVLKELIDGCVAIYKKIQLEKAKKTLEENRTLPPSEAAKRANDLFRK